MNPYLIGVDLAQAQDYTAVSVAEVLGTESTETRAYHIRHLERMRGVSYLDVAARIRDLTAAVRAQEPRPDVIVVYDRTGVGMAVSDVLKAAQIDAQLIGISIHGGDKVTSEDGYRVPKRDLVSALVVAFQNGQIRIAKELDLALILTAELSNFKLKFNAATAHDSYSAWREADHDDLVLAVAMLTWYGRRALFGNPVLNDRDSDWDFFSN